ncbi:hypothetical protein L1049_027842 [Liquidambar formosana]|uniref:BHLH domain-containing protein n=1 Tax=Liquidambar formosana TaxID=63359 RepID=A0AAP0RI14_LIQFO
MSSRGSRASRITEDEINDLVLKLQALLPNFNQKRTERVPASKILKETCSYIRKLHGEVEDLSERLSQILDSMDTSGVDVETLRSFLQR